MRRSIVAKNADGLILATLSTSDVPDGQAVDDNELLELGRAEMKSRRLISDGSGEISFSVQEIE
ncbi:MAG: hypothetical protein ACRED4_08225 [Brevundimonas sp.]